VIRTNAGFLVEVENFGRATIDFMRKNNCSYLIIPEDASFASERSSGSYPKTKVQILDRILEMMGEYKTESSVIHVYRLPSGITDDKIHEVTDFAWPKLYVDYPINGTTIELSRSNGTPAINVIGTAIDADSGIKKVEAYMDRSSFKSADLIPYNDSYKWSISFDVTSEGTKKIMVRATDNAAHITYQPVYLSIKYLK
jgi:hypothetical protein